jgi:hypothetical protein
MTIRELALVVGILGTAGCTTYQQIMPLVVNPPPGPMDIAAPISRTWDAVVETGAQHQWPAGAVARDSGVFVTGPVSFKGWNELQRNAVGYGCGITGPYYTTLTFHVRGDSTHSTLEITPHLFGINDQECLTTGKIERMIAREVEARAKGIPLPAQ